MSHHHEHHHDHDHHHHHHHAHDEKAEMSMEEKLAKLLTHWLQHNEEHAKSYELWGNRATANGFAEVGALIETAAKKTRAADADFKAALEALNA